MRPNILCDTKGMSEEKWLECRAHGPLGNIPYTVGGSDIATIFGISPWNTPLELWRSKKGLYNPPKKDNADQLMMGHLLEPIAAYWYGIKSGNTVIEDTNLYQHALHPYALANIDRKYIRKSDGAEGILECKSCTYHKSSDWADDAIPLYYEMQLRYYMAVLDIDHAAFSAVWGNNPDYDMAMPTIERDKAKEDIIFEKLEEWIWSLENDKPPTMTDVAPGLALESLARIYGESKKGLPDIEFSRDYEDSLRKIADLQTKVSECNKTKKELESEIEARSVKIAELMKEHEHGVLNTSNDRLLIDFVTKKRRTADSKVLKEKYPEVYNDVLNVSESRKVKVSIQPI